MGEVFSDLMDVLLDIEHDRSQKFTKVIAGFDFGKSDFRRTLYPQYKGGRSYHLMPDDFQDNYRYELPHLANALGIPVIGTEGVECDDLIGILVETYNGPEDIVLITGDRDWLQLTIDRPNVTMYDPKQHREITTECKSVAQFLVAKTMQGDTSDNIYGVYNCGAVAYNEFVEDAFTDPRSYTGTYEEQLEFLFRKFTSFTESNKKYKVHKKYKVIGIETLEEMFRFNILLGAIFSDFTHMTDQQIHGFTLAKNTIATTVPAPISEVQCIVKKIAGTRMSMFGDPVKLPADVIDYFHRMHK